MIRGGRLRVRGGLRVGLQQDSVGMETMVMPRIASRYNVFVERQFLDTNGVKYNFNM